jgi:type I restriction enzyme M protein
VGGRCFSVVPDGVLFGNDNAHMAIRKELVDKQCLRAVISMPAGVFQPYSGVSTAILIFTKTDAGGTDKVWFYEMRGDGFTLNAKRTPCSDDDIPDLLQRWQNLDAEADRTRKDQSFFVPVDEIRQNDYDLTFNKYKEVERERVVYDAPEVILGRFEQLQNEITEAMREFKTKYMK